MTPRDRTTPEPLWTPKSFMAALQALEGAAANNGEAVAMTVLTMIRQYEAERATLKQDWLKLGQRVLDENWRAWEFQAELQHLCTAANAALEWIDEIYPPDVFDGSSGDEGPLRIVAIRETLRRALQEAQP